MKQKLLQIYNKIFWKLSNLYLRKTNPSIIAITWSVWKTSCRVIITSILQQYLKDKRIYTSSKNFNTEIWVWLSIFEIKNYSPNMFWLLKVFFLWLFKLIFTKPWYDIIVLEYWIDKVWDMDFLLDIAKPNISIITKIDKVHCLELWNPDITAKEKYKLAFNAKDIVFLNQQDPYSKWIDIKVDSFYYGWTDTDFVVKDYNLNKKWNDIFSNFIVNAKNKDVSNVSTNLLWEENADYIWVWLAILDIYSNLFYNKSFFTKQQKLHIDFQLQPWRFSIFEWIWGNIIIDSSYNAAPLSMRKMIENTANIRNNLFKNYKIILALWEMRELWEFAEKEHRQIAWIVSQFADEIFLLWENMKFMQDELSKIWFKKSKIRFFKNSQLLWWELKIFLNNNKDKYIILFEWSQNTIFLEEAVKQVLKNTKDKSKLARQQDWWMKKKQDFFNSN